jgi:hypothetical protein
VQGRNEHVLCSVPTATPREHKIRLETAFFSGHEGAADRWFLTAESKELPVRPTPEHEPTACLATRPVSEEDAMLPTTADVVIIGGGVVGLALLTTWQPAAAERRVAGTGTFLGSEAAGKCAGGIHTSSAPRSTSNFHCEPADAGSFERVGRNIDFAGPATLYWTTTPTWQHFEVT